MHDGQGQKPRGGRWRPLAFGVMLVLVAVVGLAAFSGSAAAAAPNCAGDGTDFAGGDGTSGTPYEITTVEQLQCMNHTAHLGANFTLTDDVDASDTSTWNGGDGFAPIGNSSDEFTGSFDGQGHTISDLTINRGSEFRVGLFGEVDGGSIGNVTLANVSVDGDGRVGGLVGQNDGTVTNASASGTVSGNDFVGGLVGRNSASGSVTDSHATVTVSGTSAVGGLVGNNFHGTVTDSYATGNVTSTGSDVGGLVGLNDGSGASVATSYATGTVSGNFDVGGLVGENFDGDVIDSYATGTVAGDDTVGDLVGETSRSSSSTKGVTTSYATGTVSGNSAVGGLVGFGGATDSYWDVNTTNQTTSDGGTGLTTRELTGDRADDNLDGFDFTATWTTVADSPGEDGYGVSYPVLQSNTQSPAPSSTLYAGGDGSESNRYVIEDWYHLDSVRVNLDANYTLATGLGPATAGYDLVASTTADGGDGFAPIGNDTMQFQFTGSFDGQNHTISDLTVDRSADSYVGMIGYVGADGSVANVTLDSATVTGSTYVGGLVGWNAGDVTAANSTGTVDGTTRVGGLLGWNDGTVSEAHSHGTVNGSGAAVGGLVGLNNAPEGSISNSSTTATVTSTDANVGGFVGRNEGVITNSSAAGNVTGGQDVTDAHVGGFVGLNSGSVTRSSATGDVNSSGHRVGGLVGENDDGSVTASYATGDVDGAGNRVGGLVGNSFVGSVTASYATGDVSGSDFVGGLIGSTEDTGTDWVSVTASYATGNISGNSDVGGLLGTTSSPFVTDSYWDVNTTGQDTSDAGTGLTTTQMQRFAPSVTMTGFDFTETWNLTSAYPRLHWEGVPAITVDSLDAADTAVDEDVNGSVTVTANKDGVNAGQGVIVEVTAADGLSGLTNGNTSVTDTNGVVTFEFNETAPGTYNPEFAWANDTGVSDTATVTVVDVTAPTADAGANQTVDEDVQVDFNASNSTDNVGIEMFEWDFGDGNTSTGETTNHTYADPGTYTVDLTVTDDGGNDATDSLVVTVSDTTAPTADAGANRTVDGGNEVDFDGTASTDNGVIDSYEWEFGDGANATGATPTHTYSQPGTYTVNLTVTDTNGNTGTDAFTVTVQADPSGNGGSGGGGGRGGGGGSAVGDGRFSITLQGGEGSIELDGEVTSLSIAFAADATGTVTVEPSDTLPDGAKPIPDTPGLAFVDVTVPPSLTDSEATLQLTFDATTLGDTDPTDLAVYHFGDGEWTAIDTTVVSTADGEVVIEAGTPGFSLFAVGSGAQEPTPTATSKATPSTTPASPTATPGPVATATSVPGSEVTPTASSTETMGQPGFGIGIAVLTLAVIAITVRRRS